jgi:integrase
VTPLRFAYAVCGHTLSTYKEARRGSNRPGRGTEEVTSMRIESIGRRVDPRGSREKIERGIWKRDGKWIVGFTDADGSWRTKTVSARNLTDARAAREKLRVDIRAGVALTPTKATLADVAEDFFAMYDGLVRAGEKSLRTLDNYKQRYRTHVESPLGRIQVQALRPEHVSRWLADRRAAGLSSWTIKSVYTLLSAILDHALTRGLIAETPLKRISKTERPQARNKSEARRLSDAECASLIAHALPSTRALIATAVFSGLRQSELLGLVWDDVDFDEGQIRVRAQLSRVKQGQPARRVALKTDAGRRNVEALPELLALLREHKAAAFERGHARSDSFVFTTADGRPLHHRNVSRDFATAADRAGLNRDGVPKLSLHDLRHTFVCRLIAASLDVVEVQREAGHKNPAITLRLYAGEFERAKRRDSLRQKIAASGLGAVLEGA